MKSLSCRGKEKVLQSNKICTQTQSQKQEVCFNRFIVKILKNGVIGYSQSETKVQRQIKQCGVSW